MSIPYSDNLKWANYVAHVNTPPQGDVAVSANKMKSPAVKAIEAIWNQVSRQFLQRSVQAFRDTLRLVLKTPIRLVYRPFVEKCWWKTRERTEVNTKMAMYSVVQMLSVPAKFGVAFVALGAAPVNPNASNWLQNKSQNWTTNIDARMSKLEALKEEGLENSNDEGEFLKYKNWVKQASVAASLPIEIKQPQRST